MSYDKPINYTDLAALTGAAIFIYTKNIPAQTLQPVTAAHGSRPQILFVGARRSPRKKPPALALAHLRSSLHKSLLAATLLLQNL